MTTQQIYINAAERALARAYADGTHTRFQFIESDGRTLEALYISETGAFYFVTAAGCSCAGGRAKMLCKHFVSAFDIAGMLDQLIPQIYDRHEAIAA